MNQVVGFAGSAALGAVAFCGFVKYSPIKVNFEKEGKSKEIKVLRSEDEVEMANFKFKK